MNQAILYNYPSILSTSHKHIGLTYGIMGYMGGVLGFMLSVMLRIELSSVGLGVIRKVKEVCLYNNWISVHGLVMLFVFVMPVGIGYYGNYLLPMLIGSSEMSMPRVNGMSYVMLWIGIMLFVSGNVCMSKGMCGGWTLYPPLSSRDVDNMSISMDVCIISIHLLGLSSTMGSMNMLSTSRYGRHNGLLIYGVNLYVFSLIITSVLLIGALPLISYDASDWIVYLGLGMCASNVSTVLTTMTSTGSDHQSPIPTYVLVLICSPSTRTSMSIIITYLMVLVAV